jgi:hypothetical protein
MYDNWVRISPDVLMVQGKAWRMYLIGTDMVHLFHKQHHWRQRLHTVTDENLSQRILYWANIWLIHPHFASIRAEIQNVFSVDEQDVEIEL